MRESAIPCRGLPFEHPSAAFFECRPAAGRMRHRPIASPGRPATCRGRHHRRCVLRCLPRRLPGLPPRGGDLSGGSIAGALPLHARHPAAGRAGPQGPSVSGRTLQAADRPDGPDPARALLRCAGRKGNALSKRSTSLSSRAFAHALPLHSLLVDASDPARAVRRGIAMKTATHRRTPAPISTPRATSPPMPPADIPADEPMACHASLRCARWPPPARQPGAARVPRPAPGTAT